MWREEGAEEIRKDLLGYSDADNGDCIGEGRGREMVETIVLAHRSGSSVE